MKNNRYRGLGWLFVILIILIILVFSLVIFKAFYADRTSINMDTEIPTSTTTSTVKQESLTVEEIEKYLRFVPLSYIYDKDAYSGNKISVDNINKEILMEQIYYNTDKAVGKIEIEHEICGDMVICETDEYVLVEDFEQVAKFMYNYKDIDIETFKIAGGSVKKSDQYYGAFYAMGSVSLEKVNLIEDYEILDNQLVIYEKAGILEDNIGELNVYKYHGFNTYYKSISTTEMSEEQYENTVNEIKTEIEISKDFPVYKHTFKKHDNGTEYYWYSTEVVDNEN